MQFSLFGKHPLFDDVTIQRRRTEWQQIPIVGFESSSSSLIDFSHELGTRAAKSQKETSLEQRFNHAFFVELLNYKLYPGIDGQWSAWPKPPSGVTRLPGEPDLLLGLSKEEDFETSAVVELKKPGTQLDAPQSGYDHRTPVEQAFDYGRRIATCRWVIVTDMHFVRLYSIETMDAYHEIDLWSIGRDDSRNSIAEAVHLLSFENLVEHGADAPTARLLSSVRDEQASFRDGFYKIYSDIRADLLAAVEQWAADRYDRTTLVLGVQRLLDRLLFIYFCEDHPDRLLRRGLLEGVVERAVQSPGPSETKAFDAVKQLFRDLDTGVTTKYWSIPRYNGELFKHHDIVDNLSLSDELHARRYLWRAPRGTGSRAVDGIFGLHVFDFWRELDKDLLGNLFERSIGDLTALVHGGRPDARKAFGVFYTASRLAKFVARSAVDAMLDEDKDLLPALRRVATSSAKDKEKTVAQVFDALKKYKVADLACGSGVFLTAALEGLLNPYRKALEAVQVDALTREMHAFRQSEILKECIFGIDLLPQAVELAKLALWLTAARRNEPSAELSENFLTGDVLDRTNVDGLRAYAGGEFDLILGNPPWGAEYDEAHAAQIFEHAGISAEGLDSWEVFLGLAVNALKPGGRFGLLVPDTIFSAEKKKIRGWLLENTELEKVYSIGPDWFTNQVRMGTVILQGKKRLPTKESVVSTLVIAGKERIEAQSGRKPLEQLEQVAAQRMKQNRFRSDAQRQIQVLASDDEMNLIARIESHSRPISEITEHARGDEINADGLIWQCGNCQSFTVPGEKQKGGGYRNKLCPSCGATLTLKDAFHEGLVAESRRGPYQTGYVDGAALTRRYENPVLRFIRTDLKNLTPALKPEPIYKGPKILIRQAGVGIVATLVNDNSRCPQSIYIYRVLPEFESDGYTNEFVLAALVSRTMNYICMKKFGEIDPAKAFAKLTHARIAQLPIPELSTAERKEEAREIGKLARQMMASFRHGDPTDSEIEIRLRRLWGISGDEGRFINGFFSVLPEGQAVMDLFPEGAPPRVPFPHLPGEDQGP